MRAISAVIAVLALTVVGLFAGDTGSMEKQAALSQAPDFKALDYKGNTYSLSQYKGHVVVLEWLNPECPFVQRHYREGTFTRLASEYKDKGVVWLAVNSTSSQGAEQNKEWAEKNHVSYPILVDKDGQVGHLFKAKTTPHLFVVDPKGELIYEGAVDDDPSGNKEQRTVYVKNAIDAALAGALPAVRETKSYGCNVKYMN